jgi:hypothetical protein
MSRALGVGLLAVMVGLWVAGPTFGAMIYISSNGTAAENTTLRDLLVARGFTVTIGDAPTALGAGTNLTGVDAVLLNMGGNSVEPLIPQAGQDKLKAFVQGGGGLVTGEWSVWNNTLNTTLKTILPAQVVNYTSNSPLQYVWAADGGVLNEGLGHNTVSFTPTNNGATATTMTAKAGAVEFYTAGGGVGGAAVVGWDQVGGASGGRVLSFSCLFGATTLGAGNADFRQLLGNGVNWAAAPEPASAALLLAGGLMTWLQSRRGRSQRRG